MKNSLSKLPKLNIPFQKLRLKKDREIVKVYDILRDNYFILTPEEFVRQQFILWLINNLHFPRALMANEIGINLNGTRKRCDSVVFRPDGSYLMILEYKSPDVTITQQVFDQIVRYNLILKARYLVVTNGLYHYCCVMDYDNGSYVFLKDMPDYNSLKNYT